MISHLCLWTGCTRFLCMQIVLISFMWRNVWSSQLNIDWVSKCDLWIMIMFAFFSLIAKYLHMLAELIIYFIDKSLKWFIVFFMVCCVCHLAMCLMSLYVMYLCVFCMLLMAVCVYVFSLLIIIIIIQCHHNHYQINKIANQNHTRNKSYSQMTRRITTT